MYNRLDGETKADEILCTFSLGFWSLYGAFCQWIKLLFLVDDSRGIVGPVGDGGRCDFTAVMINEW